MKFLIFNLAVGAALIYLVTADRGDMHNAADRLYDATQGARSVVSRAVGDGRKLFAEDAPAEEIPVVARPHDAGAAARVTAPASPDAAIPTPPDAAAAGADLLAPPPVPSADRVAAAPRGAGTPPTPEALRRRAEILGGKAAPAPTASAAAAGPAMAPEERRRQLFSLAEEMELLYARSLTR